MATPRKQGQSNRAQPEAATITITTNQSRMFKHKHTDGHVTPLESGKILIISPDGGITIGKNIDAK